MTELLIAIRALALPVLVPAIAIFITADAIAGRTKNKGGTTNV